MQLDVVREVIQSRPSELKPSRLEHSLRLGRPQPHPSSDGNRPGEELLMVPSTLAPAIAEPLQFFWHEFQLQHNLNTWCFTVGNRTALPRCPFAYSEAPRNSPLYARVFLEGDRMCGLEECSGGVHRDMLRGSTIDFVPPGRDEFECTPRSHDRALSMEHVPQVQMWEGRWAGGGAGEGHWAAVAGSGWQAARAAGDSATGACWWAVGHGSVWAELPVGRKLPELVLWWVLEGARSDCWTGRTAASEGLAEEFS
eukprot:gene13778-biopygen3736